jgi:hypothetical protein
VNSSSSTETYSFEEHIRTILSYRSKEEEKLITTSDTAVRCAL